MASNLVIAALLLVAALLSTGALAQLTCEEKNITVAKTFLNANVIPGSVTYLNGDGDNIGQFVFLLTSDWSLWRSTDFGQSWEKQNEYLFNVQVPSVFERDSYEPVGPPRYGVKAIYPGAVGLVGGNEVQFIYVQGVDGRIYSSLDRGESYLNASIPDFHTWVIQTHPKNPQVAIALGMSDACFAQLSSYCQDRLFGTADGGMTWTLIRDFIMNCQPGFDSIWDTYWYTDYMNIQGGTTLFIDHPNATDYSVAYLYYEEPMDNYDRYTSIFQLAQANLRIDSDFRTPSAPPVQFLPGVCGLGYDGEVMFTQTYYFETNGLVIHSQVSFDDSVTFYDMAFPPPPDLVGNNVPSPWKLFYEAGSLWAFVDFNSVYANEVYFAEANDQGNFTWSLPNVLALSGTEIGIAFAAHIATRGGSDINSRLSYDQGATWADLPEPANHTFACQTNCHLQALPWNVFTQSSIPGLLLIAGVVGPELKATGLKSFISRDGGLSFAEIAAPEQNNATSYFVLSEHGALLTYIYDQDDIHQVFYSIDQGSTFDSCDFLNITDLTPGDIPDPYMFFTDPDGETSNVILVSAINGTHVLHWFNFTALIPRDCTFPDDYEIFTDSAPNNECLSGLRTSYWRLKPGAGCHEANRLTPEQIVANETICNCTDIDFICDECFYLSNGTCAYIYQCLASMTEAEPPAVCPENTTYIAPVTGYRKLTQTMCQGGIDKTIGSRELPCPPPPPPVAPPVNPPVSPPVSSPLLIAPVAAPLDNDTTAPSNSSALFPNEPPPIPIAGIIAAIVGGLALAAVIGGIIFWRVRRSRASTAPVKLKDEEDARL